MDRYLFFYVCFLLQLFHNCESNPDPNTCVECSRTPAACRRISGIYTVSVLTGGTYNPVVEIPFPACNINITELNPSKNYIAIKTERDQSIINSYWALGQPGQYYGAGARFSYDRQSGSCKGSCIHSEGPTTEGIVVQILYYEKNPGIAYEFTLPNHVSFTPFDGIASKQDGPGPAASSSLSSPSSASSSSSSSPSSSSSSSSSSSRVRHHGSRSHYNRHRPRHSKTQDTFEGEYYTGSQTSRLEGRPETTSALQAHIGVKHRAKSPHDYTGSRYGSHTLGGQGLSYTAANYRGSRKHRTNAQNQRVIERFRTRPHVVRKITSPEYVPRTSGRSSAGSAVTRGSFSSGSPTRVSTARDSSPSRYQSFSDKTTYLTKDNTVDQFDGTNRLNTFNSRSSAGQGYGLGGGAFRWKISGLTECTKSCGGGHQSTNVVCISVNARTQVVVTPENCANTLKPRTQTVECNTSPCDPAWEVDEWTECSVTCGSGTQTRRVECRQRVSRSLILSVSADQCGQDEKPAVAQQCKKGLCSRWSAGQWGQCNKDCGGGEQNRNVICVDEFESQIPSNYCTEAEPRHRQSCNTHRCSGGHSQWWVSDWATECSESCGEGQRRRTAVCMSDQGDVTRESQCHKRDLPQMEEACRSDAGCRGTWFAGSWERCSSRCGEGVKRRRVICLERSVSTLEIVRDERCDASVRPETEQTCVNTDCGAVWYTSRWSQCSTSCGDGFRSREARCLEDDRHPSRQCSASLRPHTREVCSSSPCPVHQDKPSRRYDETVRAESEALTASEDFVEESDEVWEDDDEDMLDDGEERGNTHESDTSVGDPAGDKNCQDSYWNCLMVTQARLCSYPYYRKLCCQSCTKV